MTRQDLAERTHDSVAAHLGQTTMKMIEAQAAADMMAAHCDELARQIASSTVFASDLTASLAARWLGAL